MIDNNQYDLATECGEGFLEISYLSNPRKDVSMNSYQRPHEYAH